ncbi:MULTISPECIES: hypothetical protein [unclassified Nocardioides]|uniref:hypothetical protein n=1 Tax=unclassified Nocardioides TaxID=2615069 RepID=UPI003015717C
MTFGLAWWLRPEERADIGTPFLIVLQSTIAIPVLDEFRGSPGALAFALVFGGFFGLLALRNCLRLLRPRPVPTTAMLVSLVLCALYLGLLVSGPILDGDDTLRGLLFVPPLGVLVVALAQESVRKVNLKQA